MIQLAVVAAVAAVAGGVIAIAARDGRIVALGLVLAMVATPLVSAPEPPALAVAFRTLGAVLAGYLLWVAARAESIYGEGSGIGPVAEIAAAVAAFCVGWLVVPVKPMAGPVAAQAAGVSLVVLAIAPLTGRNVLRVGAGFAILTLGLSLLLEAWVAPASALEEIVVMALLIGMVGATSLLISPMGPPAPLAEGATVAEGLEGPVETALESAVEPAAESTEEVEPKPDGGPPAALAATSEAAPEAAPETTPEAAPEAAPETTVETAPKRVATVRAAGSRSPRAIRLGAPARPAKGPAPVDEAAPVGGPAPEGEGASIEEATPATPVSPPPAPPVSARTRRVRPREPRP
jgi:hypothetical protein